MIDKSGNAAKVLREVLGVPVTVPVWVEDEIKEVVKNTLNKASMRACFNE